ncbi:hypothetical protein [Sphingomonas sp.]|uniref:hypothetical protein n=1 Tax=Sphingomonas sp. TaxID=28214 RepID=UPI0025E25E08|nr:hypothetical protein [Sphingomonas sp.]
MSDADLNLTEQQIKFGIFKLALALVVTFLLIAFAVSLLADHGQQIVVNCLLVALAFGLLTNGTLAIFKIVDWFEARRARSHV